MPQRVSAEKVEGRKLRVERSVLLSTYYYLLSRRSRRAGFLNTPVLVSLAFLAGLGLAVFVGGAAKATLPDADAERAVVLSPALTEIVFALGAGDKVAGVSDFTMYPPEAAGVQSCGGWLNPNIEVIVKLRPDLVLVQGSHAKLAGWLGKLGIPAAHVHLTDIDSIALAAGNIASRLGCAEKGKELAREIEDCKKNISAALAGKPRKKVFLVTWRGAGGLATIGPGEFLDEAITIAGGKNIFADSMIPYPTVSRESVIARMPEVIIECRPGAELSAEQVRAVKEYWNVMPTLPAVKNGNVFVMTEDYAMVPGPRITRLLGRLAQIIHPEADTRELERRIPER
jgi:iron complex transport system substrate-binding protein